MYIVQYPDMDNPPFIAKGSQQVRDVLEDECGGHYCGMYSNSDDSITIDWEDNVGVRFSVVMHCMTDEDIELIRGSGHA